MTDKRDGFETARNIREKFLDILDNIHHNEFDAIEACLVTAVAIIRTTKMPDTELFLGLALAIDNARMNDEREKRDGIILGSPK